MAQFFMSRARKLFQYVDLQGSTIASTESEARVSSTMSTNGEATVHIDDTSNGRGSTSNPADQMVLQKRRRRSFLILVAVCSVAIITIVALTYHDRATQFMTTSLPSAFASASHGRIGYSASLSADRQVSLLDFTYNRFNPKRFNGSWVSDHEILFPDSDGGVSLMNAKDGKSFQVISPAQLRQLGVSDWELSADMQYLLLRRSYHSVFRRSSFGRYSIMRLDQGRPTNMIMELKPSTLTSLEAKIHSQGFNVRYVKWAPVGNALAYVDFDNDIYYRRSAMSQDDRLTNNGIADEVYNGVPDWVFEEEVFEDNYALWWSPDGNKLVWGHFNDTDVEFYVLPEYGSWRHIEPYPAYQQVRYPKVGRANPKVELWMADLSNEIRKKQILPPSSLENQENHFSWVTWANDHQFAVTWMNRIQNKTVATLCAVDDLDCSRPSNEIFHYDQSGGWIDYKYRLVFNPVPPNPSSLDFVTILPAPHLKHHYKQLTYIVNGSRTFLTQLENAEVTDILQWTAEGYIYYIATLPNNPGSRHFFKILSPSEALSRGQKSEPICLSCGDAMAEMQYLKRDACNYVSVTMSLNGSFYVLECEGPDVPWSCLHHTPTGKFLRAYETNEDLQVTLAEHDLPHTQLIEVPVSGSDQKAQVRLYLPPNFNSMEQYPLIVYVYGGPGFQAVDDKWNQHDYQTYLAGSKGVVYAIIDPQGSGFQGIDWQHAVYKNFGGPEVMSTIEVTKHLQNNLHYVDSKRTAIWGWSYGGFLSLSVLLHDLDGVFQCAASVAPVVDWRLYDTYYTERYMGLEGENYEGYNSSSVFNYLDRMRNKQYFLLHGTQDDNVHYQQSMLLSAALEEKDILFRQQSYPDQDHSIYKYHTHLYHSLTDFFLNDCFKD